MGEQMNKLFGKENQKPVEADSHITKLSLYGGKHQLEFNEKTHRYKVDGVWVSGVTSMLKRIDKGEGLMQWAANCAVESYKNGADEATAKKAWVTFRDTAANTGKDAHAWISHFLKTGESQKLSPEAEPSVSAFKLWWTIHKPENIQSERIVYSAKHHYCGTCDIIFQAGNKRVIADFKTGSPDREWKAYSKTYSGKLRAYQEHYYQCALYDQAMFEEDGIYADIYSMIYITKEGKLHVFSTSRPDMYREAALAAVNFCAQEKQLKDIHLYEG